MILRSTRYNGKWQTRVHINRCQMVLFGSSKKIGWSICRGLTRPSWHARHNVHWEDFSHLLKTDWNGKPGARHALAWAWSWIIRHTRGNTSAFEALGNINFDRVICVFLKAHNMPVTLRRIIHFLTRERISQQGNCNQDRPNDVDN